MIIAPSLLAADFLNLEKEIKKLNETDSEWLHLDVMDGNFVPNLTFGYQLITALRPISTQVFDVHLMISNPQEYIEHYAKAGADYLTFHYEAVKPEEIGQVIASIKAHKMKAGISIKPKTSVKVIEDYLEDLDLVLVMSVEPGFGGQKFDEQAATKIKDLKQLQAIKQTDYLISVDGGINGLTITKVLDCDVVVAGSFIFTGDYQEQIERLKINAKRGC